jgi:hypothetical protein
MPMLWQSVLSNLHLFRQPHDRKRQPKRRSTGICRNAALRLGDNGRALLNCVTHFATSVMPMDSQAEFIAGCKISYLCGPNPIARQRLLNRTTQLPRMFSNRPQAIQYLPGGSAYDFP